MGVITIAMSNAIATSDVPKNPAVRRVWICAQLRLRGDSLRRLAEQMGVSHQAMSAALVAPNNNLEPVISGALGLTPAQLFPERFDAKGNRIAQTRPAQRITRAVRGRVESSARN